jgi:hypothetical protein
MAAGFFIGGMSGAFMAYFLLSPLRGSQRHLPRLCELIAGLVTSPHVQLGRRAMIKGSCR